MRVLFPLHLFYPSKVGGPANTLYWLCKGLVKNDHEISVVSTKMGIDEGSVPLNKWIDVDGIQTRYCNSKSKISLGVLYHSLKRLRDVDSVVLSSICFIPNSFVALAALLKKKKVIWSPRGELFDSAIKGNKAKLLFFSALRTILGRSVLFHATSEYEKAAILHYFPKSEIAVIPNYMEMPDKECVLSDYSSLIYVGRIAPIKALDKLIEGLALSKLFSSSSFTFNIIGGVEKQFHDYYIYLLGLIEKLGLNNKVSFVGSLRGKEKFRAYASARYAFLVSESENFGNVVIEAISQGTPVVASTGTPWSNLPVKHAGYWIHNTPQEIAETVDILICQSNEEYVKYREGALNYSKEFDVYEHVGEWESIL